MSDHVLDQLPGFVANVLAPEARQAVAQHLGNCPGCRAELAAITSAHESLIHLRDIAPPVGLVDRIVANANGVGIQKRSGWWAGLRAAGMVLLPLVTAAAGFWAGRSSSASGSPPSVASQPSTTPARAVPDSTRLPRFVLIFEERNSNWPPPGGRREYASWFRQLYAERRMTSAAKLANVPGRLVTANTGADSGDAGAAPTLSGYVVIRATDYDEAVQIARRLPHYQFGGRLFVYPIEAADR